MLNIQPNINFVFDRRKVSQSGKKGALELRITYNYQQKYINTGIKLLPNQWKKGLIVNCPDAMQLSEILNTILADVRQVLLDMVQKGDVDIDTIPDRIRQLHSKITFLEFCKQRANIRKYGKTKDSKQRYDRFIRLFSDYGKIKEFEDINDNNIIAYDKYLKKRGLKPYSKWNNYHRFLNSFISDAVYEGYLYKNPYKWVNIERGGSTGGIGKYLAPEEFKTIKSAQMPTESLQKVKDVFIFQTYTCLSYSDLKSFNSSKIQELKGMKVYIGERQKTSKPYTIPLLSPAVEILDKYNGKLPIISNDKYNKYLKVVAQAAGIDKPISSHWARHTGATLLLNEGVDMKIVSKVCGHSSTKITEQIYAKLLDETVVDAIAELDII